MTAEEIIHILASRKIVDAIGLPDLPIAGEDELNKAVDDRRDELERGMYASVTNGQ